jgi:acetyl-CoA C-acetyltransferase
MNAYVIDGVFTPRASVRKGVSAYSPVHPQELLTTCLESLRDRKKEVFDEAGAVYIGCVSQANDQGANIARNAALSAGINQDVSALSLNICCGSGLQAVNLAAASVSSGAEAVVIAGGVESMSRVKMGSDGGGMDGNNLVLRKKLIQVPQGISADLIATQEGIARTELDEYSLDSHKKATQSREQEYFQSSYALVKDEEGKALLKDEDHIRADSNLAALAALPPAFANLTQQLTAAGVIGKGKEIPPISNIHTAGSASGIADGAATLLIASDRFLERHKVEARAKILGTRARGSDPITMLTGPADCCAELLKSCGMSVKDVDLWEINEAFAVVPLQTIRRLRIQPERVNIKGGAIARGHPLGATGAILLTSLIIELEREDRSVGCVVLCVAGGQSVATLIQRC